MVGRDGKRPSVSFNRHKHFFGSNRNEQNDLRLRESHDYYGLVRTNTIAETLNMCPLFLRNSSSFDYRHWLQTVTLR